MRLAYSLEWPVHLKASAGPGEEALHEIYDIALAADTAGYALSRGRSSVRLLDTERQRQAEDEEPLPSPCLYVSAGFPCHTLLVFDQLGGHVANVSLQLHSTEHIAGVPASSESVLRRYHIGRVHIHARQLYVADCEFDFVYVCNLDGDVRHVISWPEELCAPMGMCVAFGRLFVCDSGHKRVRVYNLDDYRPVPGEDSPGRFPGVHSRGVCPCGQRLVAGDFESDRLLVQSADGRCSSVSVDGVGEPFAIVAGPLPDTVLVSSSGLHSDHSVKLVSVAPDCPEGQSRTLASCGGLGSGPGQLNKPRGLALDTAAQLLYVVDARNYRVQVFSFQAD